MSGTNIDTQIALIEQSHGHCKADMSARVAGVSTRLERAEEEIHSMNGSVQRLAATVERLEGLPERISQVALNGETRKETIKGKFALAGTIVAGILLLAGSVYASYTQRVAAVASVEAVVKEALAKVVE